MKRQVIFDPRLVRRIEDRGLSELTLSLCTFGLQKVPATRLATEHLTSRSHLETLRHRFLCFASRYRFRHKEPAI